MSERIRVTRPEPPPHGSAEIEVAHTAVPKWVVGEFFGTFLLVFFGCGSVCAAVATGAQVGVFQVAIVWGIGIATAIYLTGSLSSAHLNPARDLGPRIFSSLAGWLTVYIIAPIVGGLFGGGIYRVFFRPGYRS